MAPGTGEAAVLLCDKPAGATSHDVVDRVRRKRGGKVGHGGTLDPFATGLLLVLLGRATRLQRYLVALPKTYLATARLGWRSSTGDPDGELVETGRIPHELWLPQGRIRQRVPMTSAVKVGGERLYRKARRGEQVETPEREVEVYRAELLDADRARAEFEIECSSGTYVRTLIETLEDAYCETLRRVAIGPFRVEAAGEEPLTVEAAMSFLPERAVDDTMAAAVAHGRRVPSAGLAADPGATIRLTHNRRLLAVGRVEGDEIKPEVVLG
jgi:tRNA pseudouridine55 synthase